MSLRRRLAHVRTRCVRWFFAHFFRLLIGAISVSEWGVAWWLLDDRLPVAHGWQLSLHLCGPFVIYLINRQLVAAAQRQRRDHRNPVGTMPRLYYAVAFTSLFCFLFLLATGALWAATKVFLEALTVEARTAHAGMRMASSLDGVFQWLANAGMTVIALAFGYGYTVGQLRLKVTRLRLPLRNLPPALAGLQIVQISDIHIGQNLDREQLERFVACVNEQRPDLICITGDIVDAPSADVDAFLPALTSLQATYGVVAILGNHDHYAGAERVEAILRERTPFIVLRDQQRTLEIRGVPVRVIGLDDRGRDWARGVVADAYLRDAVATVPDGAPVLLLSHRPDVFPQAAAAGVALTLSGHTHGGQIAVPWFNRRPRNLAEFITDFDRGLFERDGAYLYVNSGLGVTAQRIRLCTPREITVIEVEHAAAAARAA